MRIFFLVFFCCAVGLASAVVTPLPGSTPQRALAGDVFPNPIRLRVTDDSGAPFSGAVVTWWYSPYSNVHFEDISACTRNPFDITSTCRRTANADGIVEVGGLFVPVADTLTYTFSGYNADIYVGSAEIVLTAEPRVPPLQVLTLSGAAQRAVMGTRAAEPMTVRVLDRNGNPVQGGRVEFTPAWGSTDDTFGFRPGQPSNFVDTDVRGIAVSPPIAGGWIVGAQSLTATVYDAEARAYVRTTAEVVVTNARGELDIALTNMWWAGPVETGWGVSVVKHGDQLFNVLFVYDEQGRPTWFVQPGGRWSQGVGSVFDGPAYSPSGSPWFSYDASRFVVGTRVGYMTLAFTGPERARISFGVDQAPPRFLGKSLVRQDFSGDAASPLQGVADMWWGGPAQNGWGVAILEQFGGLFAVWFTYDAEGKPTWFVMPGGAWRDASTYAGTIYRTSGTPWTSATYDASRLRVGAVGPYALKFLDTNNAILEISVDGIARTLPITRQPF